MYYFLHIIFIFSFFDSFITDVAIYGQCGGIDYSGSIVCDSSSICVYSNPYYSQCLPKPNEPNKINEWGQCGGLNYNGIKICQDWLTCVRDTDWYFQCKKIEKPTNKPLSNLTVSISPTKTTAYTSFFSTKTSTLTFLNSNNRSTLTQTPSSQTSNNIILTSITKSVPKTSNKTNETSNNQIHTSLMIFSNFFSFIKKILEILRNICARNLI